MTENQDSNKKKISNLRSLFPYLKPYKTEVFFVILTLIITSIIILFLGRIVKYLIDLGFGTNGYYYLNMILAGLAGLVILLAVTGYFRSFLVNSVGEKVIADLRRDIYSHIIKVSPEFFEITKTGDVISRMTVDTTLLYSIISNSLAFALRNIILFFGAIIALFLTSTKLTIVSVALIPIAIAPIIIMGRKIKNLSSKSQEAVSMVGSHIEETINGVKTIQSYLCEDKEISNFNRYLNDALSASIQKIRLKSLMIALVIGFAFGSIAIVLWFGGRLVLGGQMTSGELSSFIFYSVLSATSLVAISQVITQLQTASGAAGRLFELLLIKSPLLENQTPNKLQPAKEYSIKFNNVFFSYPGRQKIEALRSFNLEIKPHEKIAIVGESGSGKSTILQLLMRFYDVNFGEILINDQNIKNLYLSDLRGLFSYISQDCFIFSGTIYENIAYANRTLGTNDIEKLIDENEALHFIKRFPDGINSFVGEKGVKLSGGERQRIAIARAMIEDSPILLLDEATSALDNENDYLISSYIKRISKDKTVISVAHKLSSIIDSDRIVFMKDGAVAEIGTHMDLITKGGLYKKMYDTKD